MGFMIFRLLRKAWVIIGTKSNATTNETNKVEMIDTPMCFPNKLMKKLVEKTKGKNTVIVVSVAAKIERQTSLVPCKTALSGSVFFCSESINIFQNDHRVIQQHSNG